MLLLRNAAISFLMFLRIGLSQAQICTTSINTPIFFEDFGSGVSLYGSSLSSGITTYPYVTGNPPNGSYVISSSSDPSGATGYAGDYIQHIGDHTGNLNGYMMVINADYAPSIVYTKHVTGLQPNTNYVFSAWLSNNDDPTVDTIVCAGIYIYPNVKFQIEYPLGTVVNSVSSGNLPLSSSIHLLNWQQYGFVFTTISSQTSIDIKMINNAPGGCGNDYVVDDISLAICCADFENNNVMDTTVCSSGMITLNAQAASSYTWSTGVNTQNISINNSGTYWVQVKPQTGCKYTDTIHANFLTPPVINILKDTTVCSNINYSLNTFSVHALSYHWSTGATTPFIIPKNSGIYWVDMNINNCIVRDSATITLLHSPILNMVTDTIICKDSIILVVKDTTLQVTWWNNSHTHQISINTAGVYYVSVYKNGCAAIDSIYVRPIESIGDFVIPNIFTPNNDGKNDLFEFNTNYVSVIEFRIYNRWGKEVYAVSNGAVKWDGKQENELVDDGIYFWEALFNSSCISSQENIRQKGFVSILK